MATTILQPAPRLPPAPDRALSTPELQAYVEQLVSRPELWQDRMAFNTGGRHYASILRDSNIDVWLLCWNTSDDTGWHDHDTSSGAVAVIRGIVRETTPRLLAEPMTTDFTAGMSFCFGPDHIHRMSGVLDGSVSLHAYSPPLWRLGQYSFSPEGVLRRMSVSYADELRPLDGVRI